MGDPGGFFDVYSFNDSCFLPREKKKKKIAGDLFDVLLPMLNIYQEYVRNHHFSLQILTECKQNPQFSSVLSRLEEHSACKGRSLETFLTYPMHQIPRYIITLHEILAHTPHEHVERRSLENARVQLEHLSRQMHDEVRWMPSRFHWGRCQLVERHNKRREIQFLIIDPDCDLPRLARRRTFANVWPSSG